MRKLFLLWAPLFIQFTASAQNVGIGIAAPTTKLHVVGTGANIATFSGGDNMWITLAEGINNRGYIGSYAGNPEDVDFGTYGGNGTGKVHLTTGNAPRLTVTPAGFVGIGTTIPEQLLSISGGMVIDQGNLNNGTTTNTLSFGSGSGEGIGSRRVAGTNINGLDFYTNFLQRMTITNSGYMGIGTITPTQVLDVSGAIKIGDANASPAAGTIRYNPANKDFEGYDGTRWRSLTANNNNPPPQSFSNNDAGSNASDNLGYSVKTWENYVFVGAPNYKVGANLTQGIVKVYRKSILTNQYEFMQNITASDGVAGDKFGYSLDATTVDGDCPDVGPYSTVYLVVGAPNKNSNRGGIYLYRFDYILDQFIVVTNNFSSSDGTANDNYGYALTILQGQSPFQVLVGAPLKTINGLFAQGRAYVVGVTGNFSHPCTSSLLTGFYESNILNMKSGAANCYFGSSVAVGKKLFVGGTEDILYAVGASWRTVNGNTNQGAVYMFRTGSGSLILPGLYDSVIIASDGNSLDYFGNAICIGSLDGTVTIAANYKESGANASQGVVYIYADTSNVVGTRWWVQKNKFTAPDGNAGDHFGSSLDREGDILMIGSSNRDDGFVDAGAVYVYQQIPYTIAGMRYKKKITDVVPQAGAMMGKNISRSSNQYVFGIPDWDEPGKTDAGKIIIGEIFY